MYKGYITSVFHTWLKNYSCDLAKLIKGTLRKIYYICLHSIQCPRITQGSGLLNEVVERKGKKSTVVIK